MKKPTELQTRYLASHRGSKSKKISYKLKIVRFFINYSLHWQMPASRASASPETFLHSTEFSSTKRTSYLSYNSIETCYKPNWLTNGLIKSALMLCIWDSKSYRNPTLGLKKLELQNCREAGKSLMGCSTIRSYLMCQKSSVLSWSGDITMTLLQVILESIKPKRWLAGNTIG